MNGQVEQLVNTFQQALQKLKGTVTEILETFPTSYRVSPNTYTPNGSSPAETLMNCKIQLYVDILHQSAQNSHKRNIAMKQQFSSYHDAKSHIFKPGQRVLAKDYQNVTEK